MEALHDVVKSGKARYLGASSMYAWQFAKMQSVAPRNGRTPFVSMQNQYSLMMREDEKEMYGRWPTRASAASPTPPVAKGRLTRPGGQRTARFDNDPVGRRFDNEPDRPVVDAVQQVAEARGLPMAQIALAWVYRNPVVTAPIVGPTKPHHLSDAVAALDVHLTDDEVAIPRPRTEPTAAASEDPHRLRGRCNTRGVGVSGERARPFATSRASSGSASEPHEEARASLRPSGCTSAPESLEIVQDPLRFLLERLVRGVDGRHPASRDRLGRGRRTEVPARSEPVHARRRARRWCSPRRVSSGCRSGPARSGAGDRPRRWHSPACRVSPCRNTIRLLVGRLVVEPAGSHDRVRVAAGPDESLGATLPVVRLGGAVVGAVPVGDADRGHEGDPHRSGRRRRPARCVLRRNRRVSAPPLSGAVGAQGQHDGVDTVDGGGEGLGSGDVADHDSASSAGSNRAALAWIPDQGTRRRSPSLSASATARLPMLPVAPTTSTVDATGSLSRRDLRVGWSGASGSPNR